jgi:RNA polymerase sigma-70 factor (ECF subfamily)
VRAAAFASLFRDVFDDVLRFCVRRVAAEKAEDVAAETMSIAWRRFDEIPPGRGDQRAWLFTTARNLMLRDNRDESRRRTLAVRIAASHSVDVPGVDGTASARVDLGRAWRLLSEGHQEALALTVWEGLTTLEAAAVLGISPVAYRLRLSRARKVLRSHLGVAYTSGVPALQPRTAPRTSAPEVTR